MAVSNEFTFYKADYTQNVGNCIYPHKVVVTNADEFNEMAEYSCAMKSHFRKFGNQMSGSGNHLCKYTSLLA